MKETRRQVQDSASGIQKMSVGHQIGERSHTIGKSYNAKTNEEMETQDFINLDEGWYHALHLCSQILYLNVHYSMFAICNLFVLYIKAVCIHNFWEIRKIKGQAMMISQIDCLL